MVKVFSTQFPLNRAASLDDLLEIGKKWIRGSPHAPNEFKEQLDELREYGDTIQFRGYSLELRKIQEKDKEFFGLKYHYPSEGESWNVKMTSVRTPEVWDVAVEVDYSSKPGTRFKISKKPYLVKLLLEEIKGGGDGSLKVQSAPYFLKENSDEEFVSDFLLGESSNVMPIVYLSRGNYNSLFIPTPKELAKFLSGIAHVFVEPSRQFSLNLKREMKSKNIFGGAVGIYWPEIQERVYWMPGRVLSKELPNILFTSIVEGLITRRLKEDLTWENLHELHTRKKIEQLRKERQESVKKIKEETQDSMEQLRKEKEQLESDVKVYEDGIYDAYQINDGLKKKLEEAHKEIQILQSRARIREVERESELNLPEGDELYPGERLEVLRNAIESAYSGSLRNSRKRKILEGILKQNPESSNGENLKDEIKKLFSGAKRFNKNIKRKLGELGFKVELAGSGHYKVYAQDNENVFSMLPSTPSDYRSWQNSVSDFFKKFF
ncbi:hypothetical protein DRN73_01755 [Candidatus Pacearchaeota archaeon]|nr:MAG: hypothetical protein DRN73_01755 [Candidatus Pacearchaeota archaeon]